jgi:hypothetical protein
MLLRFYRHVFRAFFRQTRAPFRFEAPGSALRKRLLLFMPRRQAPLLRFFDKTSALIADAARQQYFSICARAWRSVARCLSRCLPAAAVPFQTPDFLHLLLAHSC